MVQVLTSSVGSFEMKGACIRPSTVIQSFVMQPVNLTRILLGGLLCGLIINIGEAALNAGVLASQWAELNKAMNKPADFSTNQILLFNVWGFIAGIVAVWTYAAIRPGCGAGPKTAISAGVLTWVTAWVLGSAGFVITGWMPVGMWAFASAWGLVEVVLATLAGAWVYRD